MKFSDRRDAIRLLAVGLLLVLPATSEAQQLPPIAEKLAKTYGIDLFGQIEAIRYTFNAQLPGRRSFSLLDLGAEDRPGHLRRERTSRASR